MSSEEPFVYPIDRERYILSRDTYTQNSPDIYSEEPYISSIIGIALFVVNRALCIPNSDIYILNRDTYTQNIPDIYSKEPYISSIEPYIYSIEPKKDFFK